jgi:hypothetical protein
MEVPAFKMCPRNRLGAISIAIRPDSMYLIVKSLLKDVKKVLYSVFKLNVLILAVEYR